MAIKIIQKRLCLYTVATFLLGCIVQPIFAVTDVSTLQDLLNINKSCAGDYQLTADIGGNNEAFLPLCPRGFSGKLNGNGYAIHDLDITGEVDKLGLFASLSKANVHDVSFRNVHVHSEEDAVNAGVLASESDSSTAENITVQDSMLSLGSEASVGGILGVAKNSTLSRLKVQDVSVSTSDAGNAGGVVGIIGPSRGKLVDSTTLTQSSYQVSGGQKIQGGLTAGGLVGWTDEGAQIDQSFVIDHAGQAVVSGIMAGGLIGCNAAKVTKSFSRIHVKGLERVNGYLGGLIGYNISNEIDQTYSTGLVEGPIGNTTGGLVAFTESAHQQNASEGDDSFWDKDSAKCNTSAEGTGESDDSMKEKSTYADWNFNSVWFWRPGHYPALRWVK